LILFLVYSTGLLYMVMLLLGLYVFHNKFDFLLLYIFLIMTKGETNTVLHTHTHHDVFLCMGRVLVVCVCVCSLQGRLLLHANILVCHHQKGEGYWNLDFDDNKLIYHIFYIYTYTSSCLWCRFLDAHRFLDAQVWRYNSIIEFMKHKVVDIFTIFMYFLLSFFRRL